MEIYLNILGYENLYEISNHGNVKSILKNKILQPGWSMPNKDNNAYKFVYLYKDGKRKKHLIHRLVASAFIPNPYDKKQVNHIDNNPSNNNVSNLEWCTASDNMKHAHKEKRLEHGVINRLTYSKEILKKSNEEISLALGERFISSNRISGKKFIEYHCLRCNKIHISRADGIAIRKHNGICNSCARTKMKI